MNSIKIIICFIFLVSPFSSIFGLTVEEYDPDGDLEDFNHDPSEDIIWKEQVFKIPKMALEQNLSQVDIESLHQFKVYIDQTTLTLNPDDRVIRLWVLLVSNRNAKTAQFIGVHCENGQSKIYAYQTKQRIRKLKKPRWRALKTYTKELARDYLCSIQNHPQSKHEINFAIKYKQKFDLFEE